MRPINPESAPVRVYNENNMAVICVKKQPSIALTIHQLQQLQYLLSVDPSLLDTAAFMLRELGQEASVNLTNASRKAGLNDEFEGESHGV